MDEKTIKQFYQMLDKGLKNIESSLKKDQKVELVGAEKVVLQGKQGEKGQDGKDGKTPKKGVDYMTKQEVDDFVKEIMSKIKLPENGLDGIDGKDGVVDYEKVKSFITEAVSNIPKPKDGKDAKVDFDNLIKRVLDAIPKPDTNVVIEYVDQRMRRFEEAYMSRQPVRQLNSAGPTTRLGELVDVSTEGATNGQVLGFNGTKWVPVAQSGGGGGGTWGSITGTVTDQTDLVSYIAGLPVSTFSNDAGYITSYTETDTLASVTGRGATTSTASTFSGGLTASTFNLTGATASRLAIFDGSKNLISADTATYPSLTELSYVKGVTSAIQTQINAKFTLPSLTSGSVLFSDGSTISQNNSNFFWDNSNIRLGIGTNSPNNGLDVFRSGGDATVRANNTSTTGRALITAQSPSSVMDYRAYGSGYSETLFGLAMAGSVALIGQPSAGQMTFGSYTNYPIVFGTNNTENMRLSTAGSLGIGTGTSISAKLHVLNTTASLIGLKIIDPTSSSNYTLAIQNPAATQTWVYHTTYAGTGSVFGVASSGTKYFQMESYAADSNYFSAAGATFSIRTIGAHNIAFFTDTSTQRALISGSSGHFVVGSTSTNGDARVHSINSAGSNHLRIGLDISNTVYANWSLGSTGNVTMDVAGASASDPRWIFSDDVSVPDEAYDATNWNGSLEVPTKNAIRDKIESMLAASGITRSVNVVSGTTSAGSSASTDYVYLCSSSFTLTMPTAVSNTNRYTIKNEGTGTITMAFTGGQNADGSTSFTLAPNVSIDLISNNSNWRII